MRLLELTAYAFAGILIAWALVMPSESPYIHTQMYNLARNYRILTIANIALIAAVIARTIRIKHEQKSR